jgi:hypothetical protein
MCTRSRAVNGRPCRRKSHGHGQRDDARPSDLRGERLRARECQERRDGVVVGGAKRIDVVAPHDARLLQDDPAPRESILSEFHDEKIGHQAGKPSVAVRKRTGPYTCNCVSGPTWAGRDRSLHVYTLTTGSFGLRARLRGSASAPRSCRTAPADRASVRRVHPTSTWYVPR